jgi:hypothetical protein
MPKELELSWKTDRPEGEGHCKAVPPVSSGKEIRTTSKNSVANHYSHCLDSPLPAGPNSTRVWPRDSKKRCHQGQPLRIETVGWGGLSWQRLKLFGLKEAEKKRGHLPIMELTNRKGEMQASDLSLVPLILPLTLESLIFFPGLVSLDIFTWTTSEASCPALSGEVFQNHILYWIQAFWRGEAGSWLPELFPVNSVTPHRPADGQLTLPVCIFLK